MENIQLVKSYYYVYIILNIQQLNSLPYLPINFNKLTDYLIMFKVVTYTIFNLFTAHISISTQSSNSVVFRLQPVYFLSTSLIYNVIM